MPCKVYYGYFGGGLFIKVKPAEVGQYSSNHTQSCITVRFGLRT